MTDPRYNPPQPERVGFGISLAIAMAFVILLCLSGCAAFKRDLVPVPSITPAAVYQLGNAYGVAQSAAISYALLPDCPSGEKMTLTVWCRDIAVVRQIAGYDAEFVRQYPKLTKWATDPATINGLNLAETYAAAVSALTGMQTIIAQYQTHG